MLPYTIAASCKAGQKKDGAQCGPAVAKSYYDDVIDPEHFDDGTGYQLLYNSVCTQMEKDEMRRLIVIGGDHSIAVGSVAALNDHYLKKGNKLYVVWIDAHADINTYESSSSKNTHGMPVAFLLGLCQQKLVKIGTHLTPDQIIYVGLRDLDPPEWKFLEDLGIKYYTMSHVKEKGIDIIMSEIKEYVKHTEVHISLDIDGIDPIFTSATGTPVEDGLSLRDVLTIIKSWPKSQMKSIDVVEFNPLIGTDAEVKKTLTTINACIYAFL